MGCHQRSREITSERSVPKEADELCPKDSLLRTDTLCAMATHLNGVYFSSGYRFVSVVIRKRLRFPCDVLGRARYLRPQPRASHIRRAAQRPEQKPQAAARAIVDGDYWGAAVCWLAYAYAA